MPNDENLYRELADKEQFEDQAYEQELAAKQLGKFQPPKIDSAAAMKRFNEDFAPVFARRKKALTSKSYRLWLKMTGQWKGMEVGDVEVVNPTSGMVPIEPRDDA